MALALALSPSDTCSHALEIATEQVCDCRAKLKGIGDRRAGAGDEDEVAVVDLEEEETDAEEEEEEEEEEETDAEEEEKEEDGDDEVEIIGEVKPKPKEDASTLFEELGLPPPPPPGATDEAIARMLADALAVAAARGARDERRREDDSPDDSSDVEVVGEVASTASERGGKGSGPEEARPATAPPARLAQVFAHLPVPEAFRREVSAMRGCAARAAHKLRTDKDIGLIVTTRVTTNKQALQVPKRLPPISGNLLTHCAVCKGPIRLNDECLRAPPELLNASDASSAVVSPPSPRRSR